MPVRVNEGGGCGDGSGGMMLLKVNIVMLIMVAMVTMVVVW